jgi:hypothetical protein
VSPALVVLAAGLASRFGRPKQLEPVGPSGEALVDFTIHDAARSGFGQVVLIVRSSTVSAFVSHFEEIPPAIPVRMVVQERHGRMERAAGGWKPWGTAHAVLAAASHLSVPFGVANADDFYGARAIDALASWLRAGPGDAALITFRLDRTLSPHGGVTRAVCRIRDGWLEGMVETLDVRRLDDGILGRADGPDEPLAAEAPVSMNLWGFRPIIAPILQAAFEEFRSTHARDAEAEFRLPDVVADAMRGNGFRVRVIPTDSDWIGLTYAADAPAVRARLREAVESGQYPTIDAGRAGPRSD